MAPKFSHPLAWQQAEQLMQPALIRVIDTIRKQLEESPWQGRYENRLEWPADTTDAAKQQVLTLQSALESAATEAEAIALQTQLATLPNPMPVYRLWLSLDGVPEQSFDLWELCYQVCFTDYHPTLSAPDPIVTVDTSLLEADTGEVDWLALDQKAKALIGRIFQDLAHFLPPEAIAESS